MIVQNLLLVEFLGIYLAPAINDIGQDEWHQERHIEHGAQCELTRTAIRQSERRLQVGGRRIVGRIVPSRG